MGDLLSDANKGLDQPKLVLFRLEIDLDMPVGTCLLYNPRRLVHDYRHVRSKIL
jgi:hypothetical protein